MSDAEKLQAIKSLLKQIRKDLNKCHRQDCEYNTSTGNGVNSSEASSFFEEVEEGVSKILKS